MSMTRFIPGTDGLNAGPRAISTEERTVTNWRDCSVETRAALAALSQGCCYFPGCRTPILVFLGDRPAVNVDATPIGITDGDSFGDLLLLCVPHRKAVDHHRNTHPVDLLLTWKAQREGSRRRALSALDADDLDLLLTTAFAAVRGEVAAALARFAETDSESARLLTQLTADLDDERRRPYVPVIAAVEKAAALIESAVVRLDTRLTNGRPAPKRSNVGWVTRI
jgi:hypothetical protein